jgi:hypothetical protein
LDSLRNRSGKRDNGGHPARHYGFFVHVGIDWAGRLQEDDFLARLYDLTAMRSTDYRVRNAAGDIRQHRINWRDWEDDWVF